MKRTLMVLSAVALAGCNPDSEDRSPIIYEETLTCYFGGEKIVEKIRSEDGQRVRVGRYGIVVFDKYDDRVLEYSPGVPCKRTSREIGNEEDTRDTSS